MHGEGRRSRSSFFWEEGECKNEESDSLCLRISRAGAAAEARVAGASLPLLGATRAVPVRKALLGALVWTLFTAGVDMVVSPKIPHLSWPGGTKSEFLKSGNVPTTFPKNLDWKEGRRSPLNTVKGISSLGAHSSPNSSFLRKICQDAYPLCPCLLPRNEGFFLVPNKSDWWDRECHTQHGASHTHTQTIGGVRWDETTSGVTCNQKPRHTPHTTVASQRGTVQFCGAEIGGLDSHLASTPSPTSRTMSAPKMKKRGSIIADTKEKLASPQVRRALTARATRNGCAVLQY